MTTWVTGTVVHQHRWNERLYSVRVAADVAPFRAGQFTRLSLHIDGERVARPYSLVNAPHEAEAEFFFNTVPEGPLSNRIAALQPGDAIDLATPPTGLFTLDEVPAGRHLWMVATGTGLGPFLSILKTEEPWHRFERLILVQGVRGRDDLAYRDLIDTFSARGDARFRYIPFTSRETHADMLSGRIPAALADGRLEDRAGCRISPADSQCMLCGNLAMIHEMSDLLTSRGLKKNQRRNPGQITTEKYW